MKKKTRYIGSILPLIGGTLTGFLIKNEFKETVFLKPTGYPPNIVFPIIWTILYILLGISFYRVSKQRNEHTLYYIVLALNFFWPVLFFAFQMFFFAFLWLVLLWITSIFLFFEWKKKDTISFYIQIPYMLWLTYAGYLNLMIVLLNH